MNEFQLNYKHFDEICRFCLKRDLFLKPIIKITGNKDNADEESSSIVQKIFWCTQLEINLMDDLPKLMCLECLEKLNNCFQFRQDCIESEIVLKQIKLNHDAALSFGVSSSTVEENKLKNGPQIEVNDTIAEYQVLHGIDSEFPISGCSKIEVLYLKNENIADEQNIIEKKSEKENIPEISEENDNRIIEIRIRSKRNDSSHGKKIKSKKRRRSKSDKYNDTVKDKGCDSKVQVELSNEEKGTKKSTKKNSNYDRAKQCQICGTMQKGLKLHMLTHSGERAFKCHLCPKSFTQRGNLIRHINIHLDNRQHKCEVCGKTFTDPKSLTSHLVVHTGEKKYKCDLCGKAFGHSHTLLSHKRAHIQDRRYECSECHKFFLTGYARKKHFRVHTGERPYKCEFCEKTFTSSGNLSIHRRVHTKGRPYKCTVCGLTFAYRSLLTDHIKLKDHGAPQATVNILPALSEVPVSTTTILVTTARQSNNNSETKMEKNDEEIDILYEVVEETDLQDGVDKAVMEIGTISSTDHI